jgi:hypothetical protein
MLLLIVPILVLIAWGVGALVGSATSYLIGALIGVAITLVVLTVSGLLAARSQPTERPDGAPVLRLD